MKNYEERTNSQSYVVLALAEPARDALAFSPAHAMPATYVSD